MAYVACNLLADLDQDPAWRRCTALSDSQSTHARHAEQAGYLRGALGEVGMLVWC